MTSWDVVVVGGGVAGLQAAIYTAKAGERTVVLDAGDSWVEHTSDVRNLLGFESVAGEALLEGGHEQLSTFGGVVARATVAEVERTDDGFVVFTDGDPYHGQYLIVASAGTLEPFESLDVAFVDGVEGQYYMDRHVATNDANRAADGVYAAGLARSWEFQTAVAIGDGARAATNLLAEKYGEPYMDHDV